MSALGQKQTCASQKVMSALLPIATAKADLRKTSCPLYSRKRACAVQMSAKGHKRTSVSMWPLCASRAVQSETIDATTDHDIVQPLTIRLLGFNFFGGRILPFVTVPKSRLLAR
jgi:hypothetical protein